MITFKSLLVSFLVLGAASSVGVGGYYGYEYFSSVDKNSHEGVSEERISEQNTQDSQSQPQITPAGTQQPANQDSGSSASGTTSGSGV